MTTPPVAVVVITRNRKTSLLQTVERLSRLPEEPLVVVVDNGSSDHSTTELRRRFPQVMTVPLPANTGSAGRNVGVRMASRQYVAFADDDSCWDPGALSEAVSIMESDPSVGLVAARVLVGDDQRLDPVSEAMGRGPLGAALQESSAGYRAAAGCVACGSVVRAAAFLAAGGFPPGLMVGGEEQILVWDLWAAGWRAVYAPQVVARHFPAQTGRDGPGRRRIMARNELWSAWARLPLSSACARTAAVAGRAGLDRARWKGFGDAWRRADWPLARRSVLPARVAQAMVRLAAG